MSAQLSRCIFALCSVGFISTSTSFAQVIHPTSYDMPNGNSGSFNYWDDTYSGAGNNHLDAAPLSGGLGDLTDGVIATDNWFVTEVTNHGPYVAWDSYNPILNFHFSSITPFSNVRIYFDDADGRGGVTAPSERNSFHCCSILFEKILLLTSTSWFIKRSVEYTGNIEV